MHTENDTSPKIAHFGDFDSKLAIFDMRVLVKKCPKLDVFNAQIIPVCTVDRDVHVISTHERVSDGIR